jgi:SNF family Na+-dependent transporter
VADDDGDGESHRERVNREFIELLNELRIALPGVQVLFAFLLTVPFSQQFNKTSEFQRDVYFVTLLLAGLSSVLLITPSAQHRWLFRRHDKEQLLKRSNRYALVGILCLAVAFCAAVLLVADFIFDRTTAIVATSLLAAVFLYLWVGLPVRRRMDEDAQFSED